MSLITARGVWLFMLWPAPSRSFVIIVIISVVGLVSVGEIRSNMDMIPTVCCTKELQTPPFSAVMMYDRPLVSITCHAPSFLGPHSSGHTTHSCRVVVVVKGLPSCYDVSLSLPGSWSYCCALCFLLVTSLA